MLGRGAYGPVEMRKEDHQIHFDMIVTEITNDNGKTIKYKDKDFEVSFNELGKIEKKDITLKTSCNMKRP